MNPDPGKDFDQNMSQLVRLLKKIIKNLPFGASPSNGIFPAKGKDKDSGIQVNFCFFNFLPVSEEELEEMDEMYDHFLEEENEKHADLSKELNPADLDFLRRHGISF